MQRSLRILSLWLAAACVGDERDSDAGMDATPTPAVEVVQARFGALPLRERLTGTLRASGQVVIYPQVSGPITEVRVENGDRVEHGDVLVRIRPAISASQVAQARASLDAARAEVERARATLEELEARFQRTQILAERNLVTTEEIETQRAQVEAARASYAQARAQVSAAQATLAGRREALEQTVVRAPITGRVGQRNAEVGMQVDPQTPLFTIGRLDRMQVEVPVTQEMLSRLREGQRVEIQVESFPDTAIEAELSRISPFLQEGSFSAEAEIDVPNPARWLLPGMFVTVDVFYGESERATLLPAGALYEDPETGERGVFTAPSLGLELQPHPPSDGDGITPLTAPTPTQFRAIDIIAEGDQMVGVRGVEPGEWVVVVGQHLLARQTGEELPTARVRPVTWERVVHLQRLQRQDLLRQFMEKQQRLARQRADSISASGDTANGGDSPASDGNTDG